MSQDFYSKAAELTSQRRSFAVATVVRVEGSSSARRDSRALIGDGGRILMSWGGRRLRGERGAERGPHAPAGFDLGAANPEEVALSIMGQIVTWRRGRTVASLKHEAEPENVRVSASEVAAETVVIRKCDI